VIASANIPDVHPEMEICSPMVISITSRHCYQ